MTEYKVRIPSSDEKRSQMWKIEGILKEFTQQSQVYKINREDQSSGHDRGKGGESVTTFNVKRGGENGEELAMVVKIKESYHTTSDDFFDRPLEPEVYIELKDELRDKSLVSLFEKLKEFANQIKV